MTRSLFARWVAPVVLVAVALALYLLTLSNVHTFDALSYIRDVDGHTGFFFHPHHLLYSPTGWLFWQSWRLFGYRGSSELALKILNSLAGVVCAFGLYRLTLRLTGRVLAALTAAGLLLFNYATWYYSVEVEVYMLALIWLLLALALLIELVTAPRPQTAPLLGLALGLSALYHQTNALLAGVVLVAVALAPLAARAKLRALVICGVIAAVIVALGYGIIGLAVNHDRSLRQLRDWMFFFVETGWWGHATRGRWIDLGAGLGDTISTRGALPFWIGIVIVLLAGVAAARRWPRIVAICVAWLAIYGAFFIWWEADNIEFWIGTLLPLWFLAGLAVASVQPRWLARAVPALAMTGTALLAFHNYPIVRYRGDAATDLQRQLSAGVKAVTGPNDLILSPGGVMELYLPYYEGRPNVRTLNGVLFDTGGNLDQAFGRFASYISSSLHAGLGVVVGREVMELPPEIFRRYDVPQARLDAFWKPYHAVMQPAVINKGQIYFWRIPPADEVAEKIGWAWTGFDWGWQAANVTSPGFEDGWCFNPQSDPMLVGPTLKLDASQFRAVEVTLSSKAAGQVAQLFYAGSDGAISDAHSVQWKLKGAGKSHTYTLPLRGTPGWEGSITRLRLDPISVGDGTPATRTCVRALKLLR